MPTGPERITRYLARFAALTVLVVGSVGCTGDGSGPTPSRGDATVGVVSLIEDVLEQRARALRVGDEEAFLATLDQDRGAFVDSQRVYFDNLDQLPIGRLRYRVDPGSLVRTDRGHAAVVRVHLQLEAYDDVPVVRPARFLFTEAPDGSGLRVARVRDRAWEHRSAVEVQPWDRGAVAVVSGDGVLGIFDDRSVAAADDLVDAVERGVDQVRSVVPHDWSGNVVVYALSETDMLEALDQLPGDDPDAIDAVTFPVPARAGDSTVASTRFVLHPRMLDSNQGQLDRLIRHELTHVALGERDDAVPTWLSEGIAEWVSVQPLAEDERLISQEAIDEARSGPDRLPGSRSRGEDFNGADQAANYGISWWACEAIVDIYGEPVLWQLLNELGGTDRQDQAAQLQQTLGMGTGQLAREAARRILATYA